MSAQREIKNIHPTAIVHPKAQIAKGAVIEPYVVINSPNVVIEEGVTIKPHVYLDGHLHIKEGTTIWPFASIGAQTQNLKYQGEETFVTIGKNCNIREYVTINSSCGKNSQVTVGDNCLIMAYCHVAHNCHVGNNVIMANGATLAGHISVGNHVNLGGLCAIHQHCRIGDYAMVGGGSMVARDLPPFCSGSGFPMEIFSLNVVGLKRNGFSLDARKKLIALFRITFQQELSWGLAKEKILDELGLNDSIKLWIDFFENSKRGVSSLRDRKNRSRVATELLEV